MTRRVTLDSNILVYSHLEPETVKGARSGALIHAMAADGVLAAQALLEFVAVVRRKAPGQLTPALTKVGLWSRVFDVAPTTADVMADALTLTRDRRLQVWDAVIWSAARRADAELFLTEDLQDGFTVAGMMARNPFALSDEAFNDLLEGP